MTVIRNRLARCFAAVFPKIPVESITTISIKTVKEWDSLAAVMLIVVLEEEFGIRIKTNELASLHSFVTIENYLLKRLDESL